MQSQRPVDVLVLGAMALAALATLVDAQGVFWAKVDTHRIHFAEGDGSQIQTIVANKVDGEANLVVDPAAGKIYWADDDGSAIRRANLDGSSAEELVIHNVPGPRSLALNVNAGKLYWSDWHTGEIKRANLDGSQVEVIVPSATVFGYLQHVAVDCIHGSLYWTEFTNNQEGRIRRANLDGSGEEIIQNGGRPYQIRVADSLAQIYWADFDSGAIFRAGLDGSNATQLATATGGRVRGFSLDEIRNKMYWLVQVESNPFPASLWRSDLEGNGVEQIPINLENSTRFHGMAVNPSTGDLFWNVGHVFEFDLGRIERLDITGLQRFPILSQSFGNIGGLAIDPRPNGKLYFVDWRYRVIRSSNLDGSAVSTVGPVDRLMRPLAFDTNRNQLYVGRGNCDDLIGSIERINTDGSGQTTIIGPLYCPADVEYDPLHDKLYWTEYYPARIQRADPDTPGNRETLIVVSDSIASRPIGPLALDPAGGKMYWVASFDQTVKLQRSNLDGTQVEDLADLAGTVEGIAIDSQAGKIYWTENETVRVANLDGSNLQDFRVDPVFPKNLGDVVVDPRPVLCTRTPLYADITGLPASVDFSDISAVVDAFRGVESVSPGSLCDLYPCDPIGNRCLGDGVIDFQDISQAVDAFRGFDCL